LLLLDEVSQEDVARHLDKWRAIFCERFHRTIKEEFYDIAFRKKVYVSLDDLQADLERGTGD